MSAPAIGALRRHFAVEAPAASADGLLVYEVRFLAWGALASTQNGVAIRLRARREITPGWRLRLGARVFDIASVAADEDSSGFMSCLCREISP